MSEKNYNMRQKLNFKIPIHFFNVKASSGGDNIF